MKTSTHTALISSSLSDGVFCSAITSFTDNDELIWDAQSDSGRRDFNRDFTGACLMIVRWWSCLWHDVFLGLSRGKVSSVWVSDVFRCKSVVISASRQSDFIRSRNPHFERLGLRRSEGSEENFLNDCELRCGCNSAVGSTLPLWSCDVLHDAGTVETDGDLYNMWSSDDEWCTSQNLNLGFNLNMQQLTVWRAF